MKQKIATLIAFAALGLVQVQAAAFDNLPEPTTGSGGSPNGTTRSGGGSTDALGSFDLSASAVSETSDEAGFDNMSEANVGDGASID